MSTPVNNIGETVELNSPKPLHQPETPQSGWWKSPASLATDPVFLRVKDQYRLASVGLYTASVGWSLTHNAKEGWIPSAAVYCGQLCAAPRQELEEVAAALVAAGLWCEATVDGIDGFVVAGAEKAVQERFARQLSASNAGKASQQSGQPRSTGSRWPQRPPKPDANSSVDWSQISGEL